VSTLSVVVHTYNPNTQKDEKGGSQIQGQPGLHREMLSQTATITDHSTTTLENTFFFRMSEVASAVFVCKTLI
jgi:hypothetical protein